MSQINDNKTPKDNHGSDADKSGDESDGSGGSYGTPSMLSDTKREESMTEVETQGSVKNFPIATSYTRHSSLGK